MRGMAKACYTEYNVAYVAYTSVLFPPYIIPVEVGIEAEANNVAWIH